MEGHLGSLNCCKLGSVLTHCGGERRWQPGIVEGGADVVGGEGGIDPMWSQAVCPACRVGSLWRLAQDPMGRACSARQMGLCHRWVVCGVQE